jgi:hypothetical protein
MRIFFQTLEDWYRPFSCYIVLLFRLQSKNLRHAMYISAQIILFSKNWWSPTQQFLVHSPPNPGMILTQKVVVAQIYMVWREFLRWYRIWYLICSEVEIRLRFNMRMFDISSTMLSKWSLSYNVLKKLYRFRQHEAVQFLVIRASSSNFVFEYNKILKTSKSWPI